MANRRRGEVDLALGGRTFRLRLTLAALAEIEAAFGAESLEALGRRFQDGILRARDLAVLLGAALRGGGATLNDEEAAALVDGGELPAVAAALGRLFAVTFGEGAPRP